MGKSRSTVTSSNSAAPVNKLITKLVVTAVKTIAAPNKPPRMPPAIGPKNWNTVKNWFSAPTRGEKLILVLTNTNATNRAANKILVDVENFFIP